jgi:endonuclease/exonuclease/phosphatase (EEP) superfamily protein YafD
VRHHVPTILMEGHVSDNHPKRPGALLAALGCALVLAATGALAPAGSSGAMAREAPDGPMYTLVQMNLCLSGVAGCYGKVAYPAVVHEAAARIHATRPDAVTLNEACRGDVERIARRTGYHLRFSTVIVGGAPLPCVRPGDRGNFGDAVLTRSAVERTESRAFATQTGVEWRRWLCVTTAAGVDVCTAHLTTRAMGEVAGNDAQCAELSGILERRAATHPVIFGGDVNRREPCAPARAWTRTDGAALQAPGLQCVSGNGGLRSPSVEVLPAMHSDHDVLLVRARLGARPPV